MIDRTTFDLRMAGHTTVTARANASGWQHQGQPKSRAIRAMLAAALVSLAARLDAATLAERQDAALSPVSAT